MEKIIWIYFAIGVVYKIIIAWATTEMLRKTIKKTNCSIVKFRIYLTAKSIVMAVEEGFLKELLANTLVSYISGIILWPINLIYSITFAGKMKEQIFTLFNSTEDELNEFFEGI